MYTKDELLIFSIFNTLEELINPNLIYKIFNISLKNQINIFFLSKNSLNDFKNFLIDKCLFNQNQIEKILNLFEDSFLQSIKYQVKEIYEICELNKITLHFYNYRNYPENLLNIKRPPYVLYTKGSFNLDFYKNKIVALVGTRNITNKGFSFTEYFAKSLKEHDYFNISGLASGIDTLGHQNTMGQTGAILAQGLLTEIYPQENKKLAIDMLENNGFLLSELPPYTKISVNNFIRRNRIQAGLADFLIIAETDIKGGTVHTFKYAREQKKKIFVADFNKNFIENFKKDLIIIENFSDFQKKLKTQIMQEKLF